MLSFRLVWFPLFNVLQIDEQRPICKRGMAMEDFLNWFSPVRRSLETGKVARLPAAWTTKIDYAQLAVARGETW